MSIKPNARPEELGCPPFAKGFPVCTATVTYAGEGYNATLGWVQLVRSTDGGTGGERFELDPFELLGRSSHPFCFFGFAPTLFDAPSRPLREDMDWKAESFLCFIAANAEGSEVRAILGFGWGFSIRGGTISLDPPSELAAPEWDKHVTLLRREHRTWDFATDYRNR